MPIYQPELELLMRGLNIEKKTLQEQTAEQ
ncbi:hypothetical protein VIBNI_B1833 [Vibrio nigripulchritudo]|uniref:Uncharacterized protein n=1 Tax=Vibrio nigripulchritudo TaxID=28173 RepID=U4KIZ8_9VIBR|nr:hypothetical protein VIBNI_B1833 [Vibrio nigripulchritudo]